MTQDDVGNQIQIGIGNKNRLLTDDDIGKVGALDYHGNLYLKLDAGAVPDPTDLIKSSAVRIARLEQEVFEQEVADFVGGWKPFPDLYASGGVYIGGIYLPASGGEAVPATGGDSIVERSSAKSPNAAPKKTAP